MISRHFCPTFHISGETHVLQRRVFQIVELLPKSCSSHQGCSVALTQVSSVYPCGSHSYLLCCRHVFENCSCSGLFLRGCNYHAHGLITAISWSWRQGGLGLCIASVKFLNCSCLEPRRPPCLLQADLFFCCKVLPPNPSPCSSPDALGGVFVSCCVVYLTAWPGTWW